MIKFGSHEWLYLLAIVPLLVLLFWLFNKEFAKRLEKFADSSLLPKLLSGADRWKRFLKFALLMTSLTVLIVALARPQFGVEPKEVKRVGIDILVMLDISLSMAAEDVAPSRLAKAKKEIERLADTFAGNRVGLLVFAGSSGVECPLTLDISTFKMFLNSISFSSAPLSGTDISGAMKKGITLLEQSQSKSKVIVLITDGEDNEGNPAETAREAAKKKIRIYTVGLGSETGAPIPIKDNNGDLAGYKKDSSGNTVFTRQNSDALNEVANITDALFISSSGGVFNINPIIESIRALEKSDISSTKFTTYVDRFQWFLGIALILLAVEILI
ncbi:MAG: VWA domain-containing protein [Nitrospinota bacterium]|nr:VWA domain-containing protein [Nitrospinota bacterium]